MELPSPGGQRGSPILLDEQLEALHRQGVLVPLVRRDGDLLEEPAAVGFRPWRAYPSSTQFLFSPYQLLAAPGLGRLLTHMAPRRRSAPAGCSTASLAAAGHARSCSTWTSPSPRPSRPVPAAVTGAGHRAERAGGALPARGPAPGARPAPAGPAGMARLRQRLRLQRDAGLARLAAGAAQGGRRPAPQPRQQHRPAATLAPPGPPRRLIPRGQWS